MFELFESFQENPGPLAEELEALLEGEGSPEGRADFALFLLTTIRHRVREGFNRRASTWERYVGIERAEDFRIHTVSELGGITGMGPVEEFGEYNRLRSAEREGPPYAIGKHGGIYAVTFEMVINDEVNRILNRIPTELGRMAAAYVSRAVVALIEANPNWIDGLPFFTPLARPGMPNGNETVGAAAVPSETNLATILSNMRLRQDEEGFPIEIEPRTIITQNDLTKWIFQRVLESTETGATSNDTASTTFDKGTRNVMRNGGGLLPSDAVVLEPYFTDPNDWILLADVGRPAFIAAFLRDQRAPFIGRQDSGVSSINGGGRDPYTLDFDEIPFKVRHLFGAALGDPRAAHRARPS